MTRVGQISERVPLSSAGADQDMEIDVGEIPTAVTLEGGAGRIPKNLKH